MYINQSDHRARRGKSANGWKSFPFWRALPCLVALQIDLQPTPCPQFSYHNRIPFLQLNSHTQPLGPHENLSKKPPPPQLHLSGNSHCQPQYLWRKKEEKRLSVSQSIHSRSGSRKISPPKPKQKGPVIVKFSFIRSFIESVILVIQVEKEKW